VCSAAPGDPAAIDAACAAGAEDGTSCGLSTSPNAWQGLCDNGTCRKVCRANGTDCTGGKTCNPYPAPYDKIGACL
jgi:hypothetical protein